MPELTRRLSKDRADCWLIYYGDVQVGAIAKSVGNPGAAPQWQWNCGFYPGSDPGECKTGRAAGFDEARAQFGRVWGIFLAKRTGADFQTWRDQRDWTARKYAMWDRGERFPSQIPAR
ncbi:hypothetical protein [Bradyrhizobium sp. Ash2021]|uniref:hypothetical protein n=1 Tax=Bradyrhizobium sp. Ash2021 TaxID=2954771 RepID=UPI002814F003|nr:hypothetical protein [Bradyrhizobium sp. Ash2021]WMT71103.1 hypothetical protein NL528_23670 [Bradyrhizobium sp. Ash2021]